jgi:transposase
MVLKSRSLLVKQQTQVVNALRSHLAELGIIDAVGRGKVEMLVAIVRDTTDVRLPAAARFALTVIADQIDALAGQIVKLDRAIIAATRTDEDMRPLTTIPGVGAITAATIKALVPDPGGFKSARHFAAWLGLTPKQHSSGGKERMGRISKMGNPELRCLLVLGATSVLRGARTNERARPWIRTLLARRPYKVAAVALANKTARIVWALLNKNGVYRRPEDSEKAGVCI